MTAQLRPATVRRYVPSRAIADRPGAEDVTAALWCACHGGQQGIADHLLRRGGDVTWSAATG
ncbi:hypothetical protein [Streptomyces sp. bgisy034]|uniref:hypothetical protein n=1 Tax=Streptomyces sp. bgisy034 TaxID=3413774 RepID=UPI003EBE25F2